VKPPDFQGAFMFLTPAKNFLPTIFTIFCFAFFANAQSKSQQKPLPAVTPTPQAEEETERVFTEEIKLNVNAFDPDGKFVADVKREDLVIIEDGRVHQASSVRRVPANVLIVLDTGGEMRAAKSFAQTRETARSLIDALHSEDSVAIMQYNDKVEIVAEWTTKAQALKILNGKANFGRRSVFFRALETATGFLQKTPVDNRHLVLITDGTDSLNIASEKDAAMKNILTTDINVHVISYTQMELRDIEPRTKGISKVSSPKAVPNEVTATLPPGIRDMNGALGTGVTFNTDRAFLKKMRERKKSLADSETYLAALARDTNGEFILPTSNDEMIEKTSLVARFIDSSYVVTYAPKRALKESPVGETRTIEVSSKRPDLQIEARRKLIVSPD